MGLMTHRDFNNYLAVFELMESLVKGTRLNDILEVQYQILSHRFTKEVEIMKILLVLNT